jgi:dTDP-glucose pyrophosphorylase/transcriptional regulator with XRE-family HTH domain
MNSSGQLGAVLRRAREAGNLTRQALASRVDVDPSYIYLLETNKRQPSKEVLLDLAQALGITDDELNKWLLMVGFAPMYLPQQARPTIRTRGGAIHHRVLAEPDTDSLVRRNRWLEEMNLRDNQIGRLLHAMESMPEAKQRQVIDAISTTITRVVEMIETPIRTVVIPAAGGQHQFVAAHVMQQLLLRAIGEAVDSGITNIVLVLAPGMVESLFAPIREALTLATAPPITLQYVEQAKPDGLGDAVLQTEQLVGRETFAVLLPDDLVGREEKSAWPRQLRRMGATLSLIGDAYLVAVARVPKSRMSHGGVAELGSKAELADVFPVVQLIERPDPSEISDRSNQILRIVGRYVLGPDVFPMLHSLKQEERRPLELTTALDRLRQKGKPIYAFELKAARQDIGGAIEQASGMIRDPSDLVS